jgi:peptidylprolyl isomerase
MPEDDKTPSVKAKLPSARDISRTDFTPHGINKGRGALKRPGNKADLRKKRLIQTGATVAVLGVVAGIGGGAYALTRPETEFKVSGGFNKAPKVSWPETAPVKKLTKKTVVSGKGAVLNTGDVSYLNFSTYSWTGIKAHKDGQSSYASGATPMPVGKSGIAGLDQSLKGSKVGSRILVSVPVKDLGEAASQTGLKATDDMVFIIDILSVVSKDAKVSGTDKPLNDPKLPAVTAPAAGATTGPTIKMPKVDPPKDLVSKTLIEGTGPALVKGQSVVANYVGQIFKTGKEFDSSWKADRGPFAFTLTTGEGGVVPGWVNGLVGQKVGSRVLLVVPPKDGYGAKGSSDGSIKGTDTLVFVVDILGVGPGK